MITTDNPTTAPETPLLTLDHIRAARERVRDVAVRTPLLPLPRQEAERLLYLKPESMQPMGAFKLRGAYNKLASLSEEERRRGVIAYSSGNHAQAVAYAARELGVRAVIVMPEYAPKVKAENTARFGGRIEWVRGGGDVQRARAEELAAEHGYVIIPPFNDHAIMAGQGTLGLEILEDLPDVETVLAPVSGGGLIGGVATALKLSRPEVRVIGVEPELAADARASLRAGRIVRFDPDQTRLTSADGLRVTQLGDLTWPHVRTHVDDIVAVTEEEIREAIRRLALDAKLVAEPSGAVSFAAWLFHRDELPRTRLNVAVISGGNIDPALLAEILVEPGGVHLGEVPALVG